MHCADWRKGTITSTVPDPAPILLIKHFQFCSNQKFQLNTKIKFFSTVIYAIEGIGAMLPVENSMKKPQYFHRVLNIGMIVVVALYVTVGFLGYVRYGDAIEPSITINLPQGEL